MPGKNYKFEYIQVVECIAINTKEKYRRLFHYLGGHNDLERIWKDIKDLKHNYLIKLKQNLSTFREDPDSFIIPFVFFLADHFISGYVDKVYTNIYIYDSISNDPKMRKENDFFSYSYLETLKKIIIHLCNHLHGREILKTTCHVSFEKGPRQTESPYQMCGVHAMMTAVLLITRGKQLLKARTLKNVLKTRVNCYKELVTTPSNFEFIENSEYFPNWCQIIQRNVEEIDVDNVVPFIGPEFLPGELCRKRMKNENSKICYANSLFQGLWDIPSFRILLKQTQQFGNVSLYTLLTCLFKSKSSETDLMNFLETSNLLSTDEEQCPLEYFTRFLEWVISVNMSDRQTTLINVDGFNDFEILQNEKGILSKAKDLLEKQRVFSFEKIKAGDETNAKKTNEAIRSFKMITATTIICNNTQCRDCNIKKIRFQIETSIINRPYKEIHPNREIDVMNELTNDFNEYNHADGAQPVNKLMYKRLQQFQFFYPDS